MTAKMKAGQQQQQSRAKNASPRKFCGFTVVMAI